MVAQKFWVILFILLVGGLGYGLQTWFFLEGDVIYLVHAAQEMVGGGDYLSRFFETNPPLILYLYTPVLAVMQVFSLGLVVATRLYVLALALLSLMVSGECLLKSSLDLATRRALLVAMGFVLIFLPVCEFGQREHLLLILTLPYWFLCLLRAEGRRLGSWSALGIGVVAGLGFALKPFFLLPLLLVEIYLRKPFRAETVGIVLAMGLYGIALLVFHPDYITTMLPLVSKYYFIGAAEQWGNLLDRPPALFCLAIAIISPFICKLVRARTLAIIFSLALWGFIFSFLLPKTAWYYHVLPALGICCLLGTLLILEIPQRLLAAAFALIFFAVPGLYCYRTFSSELAIQHNAPLQELIQYANADYPGKKNYCIPAHHACSILSAYGSTQYASRFPSFWAFRGLLKKPVTPQLQQDETWLLSLLAQDLAQSKPELVIFDTSVSLGKLKSSQDYIDYFSHNSEFKRIWAQYHRVKSIGPYEIYNLNRSP